jgi:outer membrane protein OmpA-like peptidoglycan-associated protein
VSASQGDPKHNYLQFYLAKLYYDTGEYEQCIAAVEKFQSNGGDIKFAQRVDMLQVLASFAIKSIAENLAYNPQRLPSPLNEFPLQYFPVLPADQQEIIFTRRNGWTPNDDEDIYISFLEEENRWGVPQSISENINTSGNEGTCSISGDGRTLIFTSCMGREGYGSCDLFISRKRGGEWTEPENMGPKVNSAGWDSQPSLSADGRTLYFISDRSGGEGRRDIWTSTKDQRDEWTKARNIGAPINTEDDEVSPFIHLNGQRLYFASRGHIGMGGFDIYYSDLTLPEGRWETPQNMGYPLNTKYDQVALVITPDGKHGYYSLDNRSINGQSQAQMYKLDIPEKHQLSVKSYYVKGRILDVKTGEPLGASIELKDLNQERPALKVFSDEVDGTYLMALTQGTTYGLFTSSEGYLYKSMTFDTQASDEVIVIDVHLDPIENGATVVMNNIFFETDSDVLSTTSKAEIDEVASFLMVNSTTRIRIEGHTDDTGSAEYNLDLSNRRAEAVKSQLIALGVDAERVDARGLGMTMPIANNATALGKASNRRIEFRVID